MNTTSNQSPQQLEVTLKQAIKSYELAKVASSAAKAEQKRAQPLLASIQKTEQAARNVLEKVGLARIVCAPLQLYETIDPTRRSDEAIAKAFTDAQLAQADLRISLFGLAKAFAREGNVQEAEKCLRALLDDPDTSFDPDDMLCEVYYLAGMTFLNSGQLIQATNAFENVLRLNIHYQNAIEKAKELSIQLLRNGKWNAAAKLFLLMGDEAKTDPDMKRRLDNNKKLQAAMETLAEIELLWTTNVNMFEEDGKAESGYVSNITFSSQYPLLALSSVTTWDTVPDVVTSGIVVLNIEIEKVIYQSQVLCSVEDDPLIVTSIIFDDQEKSLRVYTQDGEYSVHDLSGHMNKAKRKEREDKIQARLRYNIRLSKLLLAQVQKNISEKDLEHYVLSPNGQQIAAVRTIKKEKVRKNKMMIKIYMFSVRIAQSERISL